MGRCDPFPEARRDTTTAARNPDQRDLRGTVAAVRLSASATSRPGAAHALERALIIADESPAARQVVGALIEAGVAVQLVASPPAGRTALAAFAPQAVIARSSLLLRQELPAEDAAALSADLAGAGVPLVLTVSLADLSLPATAELAALADDFVLEPIDLNELMLRLERWRRRDRGQRNDNTVTIGRLTLDLVGHKVAVDGRPINLTHKEFELVRFLVAHRGRVITREKILGDLWGHDFYGGLRTVDVHIRRIRSKLEISDFRCIETVRNVGYKFVTDDRPGTPSAF